MILRHRIGTPDGMVVPIRHRRCGAGLVPHFLEARAQVPGVEASSRSPRCREFYAFEDFGRPLAATADV